MKPATTILIAGSIVIALAAARQPQHVTERVPYEETVTNAFGQEYEPQVTEEYRWIWEPMQWEERTNRHAPLRIYQATPDTGKHMTLVMGLAAVIAAVALIASSADGRGEA